MNSYWNAKYLSINWFILALRKQCVKLTQARTKQWCLFQWGSSSLSLGKLLVNYQIFCCLVIGWPKVNKNTIIIKFELESKECIKVVNLRLAMKTLSLDFSHLQLVKISSISGMQSKCIKATIHAVARSFILNMQY